MDKPSSAESQSQLSLQSPPSSIGSQRVHVSGLGEDVAKEVVPLNVTTAFAPNRFEEVTELRDPQGFNNPLLLEVVEAPGSEAETDVRIVDVQFGFVDSSITGTIEVRAAIGCERCDLGDLQEANPTGAHDASDPGSGFLYYSLRFGPDLCGKPSSDTDGGGALPQVGQGG